MGKDQDRQNKEFDLDQLLKESFGMDDKSLLERFQSAQTEINDSQIPPEPEDGFERLVEKIEERGIRPKYKTDFKLNDWRWRRRRLKPAFKVALVAGIVSVGIMAGAVTTTANKYYKYNKRVKYEVRNNIVLDNNLNYKREGRLLEAYNMIEQQIGIASLRLEYIPADMIYLETIMNGKNAMMCFEYKGHNFYISQQIRNEDNSTSIVSDRKVVETESVFCKWINKDVEVEEALLKSGQIEFSSEIILEDSYYYLAGIMDKNEFFEIIENIYFEKGEY